MKNQWNHIQTEIVQSSTVANTHTCVCVYANMNTQKKKY